MSSLESLDLVVLIAVFERQCFKLVCGEIRAGFEIKLNHLIGCADTLFFKVLLECCHIAGIHPEDVQCFQSLKMHTFWPLPWGTALE